MATSPLTSSAPLFYSFKYEPIVPGFETPPSPESSYDNIFYITEEEEKRGPQWLPPHLKTCVLNKMGTRGGDASSSSPPPNHVVQNHVYTVAQNRGRSLHVEAIVVSTTERLGSEYVTTVLYKPAPQR
ncbi:hypothetical protein DM860_015645 [Cuscuta australis]|uniref:Association with the SNF1 complex (ASC) domain-containing protein n=1 Tax=Cuscuta australis TaxID=267555 RepID=A0A328DEQ7_9ASTE|nr:hypothetical protein DM860_015645 [Cuscuta australis]